MREKNDHLANSHIFKQKPGQIKDRVKLKKKEEDEDEIRKNEIFKQKKHQYSNDNDR